MNIDIPSLVLPEAVVMQIEIHLCVPEAVVMQN